MDCLKQRDKASFCVMDKGLKKDGEIVSDPAGINNDGKSKSVQDGSLEINGKTYTVRELASQEMKNSA